MEEVWLKKIIEWKSIAFRLRKRLKMKWEGYRKQDLKVMKIYHWKKQGQSRNDWKQIVEQAKIHKEL
jgi:hypothetical protein